MKNLYIVVRSISFGKGVGGMEKAAEQHIYEMYSQGYCIHLVAPKTKIVGDIPSFIKHIDVSWPVWDKYKILMTMGAAYFIWCKRVAKKLTVCSNNIDIIHLHGASAGVLSSLNKQILRSKATIVNPHGMEEFGTGSILRIINRGFTRHLLRKASLADTVIATDKKLVETVRQNLNTQKITVIPNTIDINALRNLVSEKKQTKDYKIVSVGRIEYNKGYDILAQALANLIKKEWSKIDFSWDHYGRGKNKTDIEDFCRKNNIKVNINSTASDEEVQTAIASSNLFVQPSRYEGSSLTTLEAMTHGALIVAMPVGGIPDKIFDKNTGFLCKEVSSSALEISLKEAMKSTVQEVIRNNALHYVEENFDIRISTEKYDSLYKTILAEKDMK
ncbi:TPA: glycosyltransferase family 4 protein [Raoultella ornithinolytica]|uniref:glycosyltransferase family 4 protein n=1 Tax=Raoultella ornithinolytica TaxID=54291 RepID=UPI002DB69D48|nr:glycosyltransferase family 4 protein [Raoultella ornithinolytica]MEB7992220.1 glycosyltransferase family 4 protein [Raoultella ornithinolytica]